MESMGRKKPRRRRSFTPDFKAEIVELCQRGDRSVDQVARDFDLTETAVRELSMRCEGRHGVDVPNLATPRSRHGRALENDRWTSIRHCQPPRHGRPSRHRAIRARRVRIRTTRLANRSGGTMELPPSMSR